MSAVRSSSGSDRANLGWWQFSNVEEQLAMHSMHANLVRFVVVVGRGEQLVEVVAIRHDVHAFNLTGNNRQSTSSEKKQSSTAHCFCHAYAR